MEGRERLGLIPMILVWLYTAYAWQIIPNPYDVGLGGTPPSGSVTAAAALGNFHIAVIGFSAFIFIFLATREDVKYKSRYQRAGVWLMVFGATGWFTAFVYQVGGTVPIYLVWMSFIFFLAEVLLGLSVVWPFLTIAKEPNPKVWGDEDLSEEKAKRRDMGAFDSMIAVLFAFIMIYVGWEILYPLNPWLAILFILTALFVVFRAVAEADGVEDYDPAMAKTSWQRKVTIAFGIVFAIVSIGGLIYSIATNENPVYIPLYIVYAIVGGGTMIHGKAIWRA